MATGSIIHSDCWKAYNGLGDQFVYKTVNHSKTFKDPLSGVHTSAIEGNWSSLKQFVPKRRRCRSNIMLPLLFAMAKRNKNLKTLLKAFTQ